MRYESCLLAAALLAGACSRPAPSGSVSSDTTAVRPAAAPASPASGRLKLRAAIVPGLCVVNWTVAREKGFFTDEGLDVELLPPDVAGKHEHALAWLKTDTDVVRADLTFVEHAMLAAIAKGTYDYYVVAGEHSGCHQLVVPVRSPVRTIADLNGKRIGIPTTEDTGMWDYLARQAGLGKDALKWMYVPIVQGGNEELEYIGREFAAGRLDAFVTTDPVGEILKAEGVVRHLASNTWTPPLNAWYCCMVGIRRELLDANPGLARSATRAIRRAAAFVERDPAEAVRIGLTAGQLRRDMRTDFHARLLSEYVWAGSGRIQEDLERYFQFLIEGGKLPATASPAELVKRVYRGGE